MMYIGSAGLMIPVIQKSRENQSGVMSVCSTSAGVILALGLGNVASKILNRTIDKIADFWDDVKPGAPASKKEEEKKNG